MTTRRAHPDRSRNQKWTLTLIACALTAVGLPIKAAAAAPEPTGKLNILLLTVDDMNWDSVGAFGCRVPHITPHIDQLAQHGLRFEHAHVTIAICQPTRAVWMTGRYPHRSGALGFDPIRPGVPTLLEGLHQAGYFTGILAKVNHVVPTRRTAWDVIVPANRLKSGRDPQLYYQQSRVFFEQSKRAGKPFFLMANAQDPHRPFAGSRQEQNRIVRNKRQAEKKKQTPHPLAGFPSASRTYQPDEITVPGFLPDLPAIRTELAQYFTSVHRADEIVGGVLRALRESGQAEQTLVLFLSDHGMPLPFAKTNCWLHSTKTPLIVRWPGVTTPGRTDASHLVSGIDVAPTLLEAVGLPALPGTDGRSLVPLLKGKPQPDRQFVFTYINRTAGRREYPMRCVQNARYGYLFNGWADGKTVFRNESQNGLTMKAMRKAAGSNPIIAARVQHFLYRTPEEFYDYQTDPDARANLIDDPRYQTQIAQFRERLKTHLEETNDPQRLPFVRLLARRKQS